MAKKKVILIDKKRTEPVKKSKEQPKLRVAAYARVSTDKDEQFGSFDTQVSYYTQYINRNPAWIFVKVYADEGISGVYTKNRTEFNKMIEDALAGKIDLILTKSVSRFARNTVDTLTTIRRLKEHKVECYFEKEGISTFDAKGEFFLTMMSSFAQEESHSISENIKWSKRKKFQEGSYGLAYSRFLGYTKGPDGELVIVPEEARIVRYIYLQYLLGRTPGGIANQLTSLCIPSPTGSSKWPTGTIQSILTNEKYYGAALLQKTFIEDFLTKKVVKNTGQLEQYYIPKDHEPIISMDIHEMVLKEIERRKPLKMRYTGVRPFSGKIVCGNCNGYYSIIYDSNFDPRYKKAIWKCSTRLHHKEACHNQSIHDADFLLCVEYAIKSQFKASSQIPDDVFRLLSEILKSSKRKGEKAARLEMINPLLSRPNCLEKVQIDIQSMETLFQNATILNSGIIVIELIDGTRHDFRIPGRKEHGTVFPLA